MSNINNREMELLIHCLMSWMFQHLYTYGTYKMKHEGNTVLFQSKWFKVLWRKDYSFQHAKLLCFLFVLFVCFLNKNILVLKYSINLSCIQFFLLFKQSHILYSHLRCFLWYYVYYVSYSDDNIRSTFSGCLKLHPDSNWKWHISDYCQRSCGIGAGSIEGHWLDKNHLFKNCLQSKNLRHFFKTWYVAEVLLELEIHAVFFVS